MKKTFLMLLTIVGLGCVLSACGGQSDKERFIEEADARCRVAAERVRRDTSGVGSDPGALVQASLPSAEALLAELQSIEGPDDDPKLSVLLTSYQALVNEFRAAVAARQAGDTAAERRSLTQIQLQVVQLQTAARDYGLKDCGQPVT